MPTLVFDASVLVDSLVSVDPCGEAARRELADEIVLHVPAIFAAEAVSALRTLLRRGLISTDEARRALDRVLATNTTPYAFEPFAQRIWDLRENLTTYDAWYVALAEALGATLVTGDERLLRALGPACPIRLPGLPR